MSSHGWLGSGAVRARAAAGISLIEMLVALLIIAVGLLGVAGLQAYSLKNNTSAYHRSVANALIYDIFDAMRANREIGLAGSYNVQLSKAVCTDSDTQLNKDICAWLWRLDTFLPAGDGVIACGNAPSAAAEAQLVVCTVTVRWDDTRGQGAGATQEMTVSGLL